MKKHLIYLSSIALFFASCSNTKELSSGNDGNVRQADETAVLWQQTSAEYEALCHQAYNVARMKVLQEHQSGDVSQGQIPAVIMDLDETVFDNSPYFASLIIENKEFSEKSWNEWVETAEAESVPGATDFIRFITESGIEVLFITNRSNTQREATILNLGKLDIEVKPENLFFSDDTPDKSERRSQILPNYKVILLIGDDLSDFNDSFDQMNQSISQRKQMIQNDMMSEFGNRFILLPNPIYGTWKDALKLNDTKYKGSDKYDDERMYLKSYY